MAASRTGNSSPDGCFADPTVPTPSEISSADDARENGPRRCFKGSAECVTGRAEVGLKELISWLRWCRFWPKVHHVGRDAMPVGTEGACDRDLQVPKSCQPRPVGVNSGDDLGRCIGTSVAEKNSYPSPLAIQPARPGMNLRPYTQLYRTGVVSENSVQFGFAS